MNTNNICVELFSPFLGVSWQKVLWGTYYLFVQCFFFKW